MRASRPRKLISNSCSRWPVRRFYGEQSLIVASERRRRYSRHTYTHTHSLSRLTFSKDQDTGPLVLGDDMGSVRFRSRGRLLLVKLCG